MPPIANIEEPKLSVSARRATLRHRIIAAVRRFFDAQGFVEVDTFISIRAPAPELYIDAVPVTLQTPQGPQARFLQTSPELAMKRLVAAGLPKIYQIAPVFRDGDVSASHTPEFRMLEWYRADAPWTQLQDDCQALLRAVAQVVHGGLRWHYQGQAIDLEQPARRISVDEAFRQHAGFSLYAHMQPAKLRAQLDKAAIHHAPDDSWSDLFHRMFLARVEPALLADPHPLLLTHFPAQLASLAQLCPDEPRAAERFEMYAGGLELANGFGELTCAQTQRLRFVQEAQCRAAQGKRAYPLDETFLAALEQLPPTSGIALGIERMLMFVCDHAHIDAVTPIAWSHA